MGISDFQEFIETQCKDACVSVDLLQIARSYSAIHSRKTKQQSHQYEMHPSLCIAVDAESCLDRLYGGYYSDWVCGGQWNRMTQFLSNLVQACEHSGLKLSVIFNGALESQHMKLNEWFLNELKNRKNANQVLKHINNRGTPPPKVWWLPPVALGWALRMALRYLQVDIACTMEDHHQEVMGYCREYNLQGVFAHDAKYAIFDPPRYFSSQDMKLTYKGSLETKEYIIDQVAKSLNLHPNRFCVLAALLGNHILGEIDLQEFFKELLSIPAEQKGYKLDSTKLIHEVVAFVRSLPSAENLDSIGEIVFRKCNERADKISRFKLSVQYYLNGTQEGFLKYRPKNKRTHGVTQQTGGYPNTRAQVMTPPQSTTLPTQSGAGEEESPDMDQTEVSSVYTERESGYGQEHATAPEIVIEAEASSHIELDNKMEKLSLDETEITSGQDTTTAKAQPNTLDVNLISSSSSSSSGSSPSRQSPDPAFVVNVGPVKKTASQTSKPRPHLLENPMPSVIPEIMRIASERHQKGLMLPWLYQVLAEGGIKIPVSVEPEQPFDLPLSHELYRPIRVQCYAILYNLNKKKREQEKAVLDKKVSGPLEPLEVVVKEWWVQSVQDKSPHCVSVLVKPLPWRVPTLESLWLGQKPEYKQHRLRAFLQCMRSDTPLMLNTSYVPQHLLIMCCLLRYMVQYDQAILQRIELDAFLAQSVSPLLQDVQTMQDMKLPLISPRAVHLASLFMHGIETTIFVNDVCGIPIPAQACFPWQFFDGKLFHYKILKASNNPSLIDMCDGHVDQVLRVERMRQAILEGLPLDMVHFARPTLAGLQQSIPNPYSSYPMQNARPAGASYAPPVRGRGQKGRGRGLLGEFSNYGMSAVDPRGGTLQIAGQVVASWGPSHRGGRGRGTHVVGRGPLYPHNGGGQGRGRAGRQNRKPRGKGGHKVSLNTIEGAGRGRGCTIENPADGLDMSVKDLIGQEESLDQTLVPHAMTEAGQFSDADVTIKKEVPQITDGDDNSPAGVKLECYSNDDGESEYRLDDGEDNITLKAEPATPEGAKPSPDVMSPDSGIETVE